MTTKILGISAYYHDSAACLAVDGEIAAAAQEERFSRTKHDAGFPRRAIESCLAAGGLASAAELDAVVFYDKPIVKFQRLLETYLQVAPAGLASFQKAMPQWLKKKLKMRQLLAAELGYDGEILFTEHHEAHAASAFFPSPFERAAILTVDGVGERATASIGRGEGGRIEIEKELWFPHSLGLLYSAFTYFTGFAVNSGEYKLMGLAPYGEPRYVDLILSELVELHEDGSLALNMAYFDYCAGLTMTHRRLDRRLGGPPRAPEGRITQREMDLARSLQVVTEEAMLRMARHAHEVTGAGDLVLAGGVALNCVANGRILREGPFERLWIQPAAGDAGGALGAALFAHHQLFGGERVAAGGRDRQRASLLGPAFGDGEIGRLLESEGVAAQCLDDPETLAEAVAELLAAGKVVGWFQGRMEFGPRALGARSILADPRSADMQSTLNLKIKFRESFRPFAPAVLAEHAGEYFELDVESPYMLLVTQLAAGQRLPVVEEATGLDKLKQPRSTLPAITHVDGSARIQTVRRTDHPLFHRLLTAFHRKTGCPALVNTSFNVRGEPIVHTPVEALRCFRRTGMDHLVLGSYLVGKQESDDEDVRWGEQPGSQKEHSQEDAGEAWEARRFGLILGTVFLVIAVASYLLGHPGRAAVFGSASAAVLFASQALPALWRPVHRLWMKLAMALGRWISWLVLCLFYYLVLTPAGLLKRLLGSPALDIAWQDGRPTHWREKPVGSFSLERYRKQY